MLYLDKSGDGLDGEIEIDELDEALRYFRKKFAPSDHVGFLAKLAAKGSERLAKYAQLAEDREQGTVLERVAQKKEEAAAAAKEKHQARLKEWQRGWDTAGKHVYK